MRVGIGSDHAGFDLKTLVAAHLRAAGHEVVDFGPDTPERTDYPLYGERVGRAVASGEVERGVLVCGTGIGISIAANKVPGVRCACVSEPLSAALSRAHNDANVIALGARVIGPDMATSILDSWFATEFEGGRHADRVALISRIDAGRAEG